MNFINFEYSNLGLFHRYRYSRTSKCSTYMDTVVQNCTKSLSMKNLRKCFFLHYSSFLQGMRTKMSVYMSFVPTDTLILLLF